MKTKKMTKAEKDAELMRVIETYCLKGEYAIQANAYLSALQDRQQWEEAQKKGKIA